MLFQEYVRGQCWCARRPKDVEDGVQEEKLSELLQAELSLTSSTNRVHHVMYGNRRRRLDVCDWLPLPQRLRLLGPAHRENSR